MRQLFIDKNNIKIKDVCKPLLDDNLVLVAVHYSFISTGTEAATINAVGTSAIFSNISSKIQKLIESMVTNGLDATQKQIQAKLKGTVLPLGYSCSGQVIAVGKKITSIKPGDYVACAGAGLANHADIVCVPENLLVKVDKEFLRETSITTIGAIAMQGVRRTQPQLGETVCVIGLGLIGQLTVQLLKQSGCRVIGIDLMEDRLSLAEKFGADLTLNAQDPELQKTIEFYTHHHGVDATIITAASKSDAIVQQAMEVTRKKGKVVLVGDVGLNIERAPFYEKEIDFLISCSYGPGRYDPTYEKDGVDYPYSYVRWTENRNMQAFIQLIQNGSLNIDPLISNAIPLEKAADAYKELSEQKALGMVLSYKPETISFKPESEEEESTEILFKPAHATNLRVGIIGVGGFAQNKLMPIISKINNVSIDALVDANNTTAINSSRLYGSAKALTADTDLFKEDLCDVVVIASPHKYHCDHALNALKKGKGVFLEKPMVTDFHQFEKITAFLKEHPTLPFCVDYNRSFSPFIRKIKEVIKKKSTPLMVHYRMNAGFISKTHWVQTDLGAGRIIGEACHIFDLFYFLTDAEPVAVSVETLNPNRDDLFTTDNFSAQIRFSDGSVCTLMYTALGHNELGKERMELFYDSKAIVMNDYTTLLGYGLPKHFNEKLLSPDKGHEYLLNSFIESIKEKKASPIKADRLNTVAKLTLIIDQLACQGGGEQTL